MSKGELKVVWESHPHLSLSLIPRSSHAHYNKTNKNPAVGSPSALPFGLVMVLSRFALSVPPSRSRGIIISPME